MIKVLLSRISNILSDLDIQLELWALINEQSDDLKMKILHAEDLFKLASLTVHVTFILLQYETVA